MNLNLLRWLLSHRDLLAQVIDAVRPYRADLPPLEKWAMVDKVARLVIPVLVDQDLVALESNWDDDPELVALQVGSEYAALGVDWATLVKLIIPILEIILRALAPNE